MLAHKRISLSCLYNESSFLTRIGGLSACIGNVVHSTYTTGTHAMPDIYTHALGPAALGPAALGLVRIALEPVV